MNIPYFYLNKQFSQQRIEQIWENRVKDIVIRGDFTLGKEVGEFEDEICKLLKVKHCIGVGNGTDALVLALNRLGIKEGDEVITHVSTFYATAASIKLNGATPVFVDSGPNFVMDHNQIEKAITDKTKAILPVHFSGQPVNMDVVMDLARAYNLLVVEDNAQGMLGTWEGDYLGTIGHAGCFSFHPQKNLNCWGDGGMIVTNDDELANKLRLYRNHGMIDRDTINEYSPNSRLDTLHAGVLLEILPGLEKETLVRNVIASKLDLELSKISQITLPQREENSRHAYHLYMFLAEKRDELLDFLIKNGIEAKIHYKTPLHLQEASQYLGLKKHDFVRAVYDAQNMISLPIHPWLEYDEIFYMTEKIKEFYNA